VSACYCMLLIDVWICCLEAGDLSLHLNSAVAGQTHQLWSCFIRGWIMTQSH
jgi:hypothetical protein